MLPIQDAVPSGRVPRATIALVIINILALAARRLLAEAFPTTILLSPFLYPSTAHFIFAMTFLWLFGDNVEARLGRVRFVALYAVSAAVGTYAELAIMEHSVALGGVCAVSGVLGAYFVLLPKSRILVLVPIPLDLAEVPVLFFLGLWWLLHVISFVAGPWAAPSLLLPLAAAFAAGAVMCFAMRHRVVW